MGAGAIGDLFKALPISGDAKADLARRMDDPARRYHTRRHLQLLWDRHNFFCPAQRFCDSPLESSIALAIAYHDAVYVAGARDNEACSAMLWLDVSTREVFSEHIDREWIAETIRATADHVGAADTLDVDDPRDMARQWVLDLDLTPLGEAPDVFDANMKLLAAENTHLSATEQTATLLAALRHYASARSLYRCSALASAFEAKAHNNFRRHLKL